ncbi:MAG: glycosyltransferase family 39 protein [Chitinophagaceae bacterium]|nr:glycosyltransferase family 39 protein [Chitinophagaceae bacterium]
MKQFVQKNHRLLFYGGWLLLGLLQATLTELQDDEAYYWVFSRYPAWGYFDHPPMTAMLVKAGYAIFPNELGVRIFPLLLHVLSLYLVEQLTDKKQPLLFYTITLSLAALQLTGFMAVPDVPLICFTAFFFLCYKKFLAQVSLLNTVLLGMAAALLLYSKYHAVLIIFFTLLSNWRLLARYQTWLAGLLALALFTPHLYWEYQHNWISFRYHLFESNVNPYKVEYSLSYLGGQLLLAGPVAGFILLPAAFLYKPVSPLLKALKFTMIGIYAFFFLSSFRGKVEGNWTSPALVPLIVLSYHFLLQKINWQRWLWKLLPVTLLLVVAARIIMIEDILPVRGIQQRFHAWKKWPAEMRERTKGLPVVFSNSYQRASKYWFYSGQITLSQNDAHGRRNNFNFWPLEQELIGKPVYFLDVYDLSRFNDSLKTPLGYIGYRYDSSFLCFGTVSFSPGNKNYSIRQGDSLLINCYTALSYRQGMYISESDSVPGVLKLIFFQKNKPVKDVVAVNPVKDIGAVDFTLRSLPALPKGDYTFRIAIQTPGYNPTPNSEKYKLKVE